MTQTLPQENQPTLLETLHPATAPAISIEVYDNSRFWFYGNIDALSTLVTPLNMADKGYYEASLEVFKQFLKEGAAKLVNGIVTAYMPNMLPKQAENSLAQARISLYNHYSIYGEPIPQAWISYLKQLQAIANGTDTTSTSLPAQPEAAAS